MEGGKGRICSKASDWERLFLTKAKVKQNSDCPNKG